VFLFLEGTGVVKPVPHCVLFCVFRFELVIPRKIFPVLFFIYLFNGPFGRLKCYRRCKKFEEYVGNII
jgi:hypothetical protein